VTRRTLDAPLLRGNKCRARDSGACTGRRVLGSRSASVGIVSPARILCPAARLRCNALPACLGGPWGWNARETRRRDIHAGHHPCVLAAGRLVIASRQAAPRHPQKTPCSERPDSIQRGSQGTFVTEILLARQVDPSRSESDQGVAIDMGPPEQQPLQGDWAPAAKMTGTTQLDAAFSIAKAIVGAGSFALPWVFKNEGVLGGTSSLLISALLSSVTIKSIAQSKVEVEARTGKRGLTYVDVARESVGEAGATLVFVFTLMASMLVCSSYIAFVGSTVAGMSAQDGNIVQTVLGPVSQASPSPRPLLAAPGSAGSACR
jgi:hypothetical protein